jgi:hypothetical protein
MKHAPILAAIASLVFSNSSPAYDDPRSISKELAQCAGVLDAYGDAIEALGKPSSGEILRGRGRVFRVAAVMLLLDEGLHFGREFAAVENQETVDSEFDKGRMKLLSTIEYKQWDKFNETASECTAIGEQYSSILQAALAGPEHETKYGSPTQWTSADGRYSANYMVNPELLSVSALGQDAISYQSRFDYDSGWALFAITKMKFPDAAVAVGRNEFVRQAHNSYAAFLGANTDLDLVEWRQFDRVDDRMIYEINYVLDDVTVETFGFWVVYGDSIVRVSVTHNRDLAYSDERLARRFPMSFHFGESESK